MNFNPKNMNQPFQQGPLNHAMGGGQAYNPGRGGKCYNNHLTCIRQLNPQLRHPHLMVIIHNNSKESHQEILNQ